jgi:hypothetical protein
MRGSQREGIFRGECFRAFRVFLGLFLFLLLLTAGRAEDRLLIVTGVGGEAVYGDKFAAWTKDWQDAGKKGQARVTTIGAAADEKNCVTRLGEALAAEPAEGADVLWVVLLGHGTASGSDARFNVRGDDVTVAQFSEWLKRFQRPVVVICGFSCSGAWLKPLAAPGRVVVAATRAGSETNFSRFGGYLAETIADPAADLDKDGQTSLLEAFVAASRMTADFYKTEGRLATEHALLDDNGDGAGTPGDWFRGVRAVKKPNEGMADGQRAHQLHLVRSGAERILAPEARAKRDQLEQDLEKLRTQKATLPEPEYLQKLEAIMVEIAKIYRAGGAETK